MYNKSIIIIIVILLCIGCSNKSPNEKITYRKIIPDSLSTTAADKFIEVLETIKSNDENAVKTECIKSAESVIINLYGVTTIGLYDVTSGEFIPYELCSDEQKKLIDKFLTKER